MIGTLHSFVYDCPDPAGLANFYQAVLEGEVTRDSDGDDTWVTLAYPGSGTRLSFQSSPEFQPPVWPGEDGQLQAHLDVQVQDLDAADKELTRLGARRIRENPGFWVYLDPAGHPFCTFT